MRKALLLIGILSMTLASVGQVQAAHDGCYGGYAGYGGYGYAPAYAAPVYPVYGAYPVYGGYAPYGYSPYGDHYYRRARQRATRNALLGVGIANEVFNRGRSRRSIRTGAIGGLILNELFR